MTEKKYYYGIIFWNEKTDEEVFTFFMAESFYDAEKVSKHKLKGENWIEGALHFIDDDHKNYNIPLNEFVEMG